MREIKFRGRGAPRGKQWFYGDLDTHKRKFHLSAVVRWDERLARFVVISKEILDSIPDSECVSVISNIHDNPGLLGVEA